MSIDVAGTSVEGAVRSVNLARPQPNPDKREVGLTGIDKVPTTEPVLVRAPGTKTDGVGSGLVGDMVGDRLNHGGDAQAVYAYAREDLDHWESVLGRTLAGGVFGENLTTTGVDVNAAVIGERWAIGDELVLAVTVPRIPCGTFRAWIAESGWLRTFARAAMPGTYLSVVRPGLVRAGDPVTVVHRPAHGVTVAQVFRALTLEPELLPVHHRVCVGSNLSGPVAFGLPPEPGEASLPDKKAQDRAGELP